VLEACAFEDSIELISHERHLYTFLGPYYGYCVRKYCDDVVCCQAEGLSEARLAHHEAPKTMQDFGGTAHKSTSCIMTYNLSFLFSSDRICVKRSKQMWCQLGYPHIECMAKHLQKIKDERDHLQKSLCCLFHAVSPEKQQAFSCCYPDILLGDGQPQPLLALAHDAYTPTSLSGSKSDQGSTSNSSPSVSYSPQQPLASDISRTPVKSVIKSDASTEALASRDGTPDADLVEVASLAQAGQMPGAATSTLTLSSSRCASSLLLPAGHWK
jgi:hypothetical protein